MQGKTRTFEGGNITLNKSEEDMVISNQ